MRLDGVLNAEFVVDLAGSRGVFAHYEDPEDARVGGRGPCRQNRARELGADDRKLHCFDARFVDVFEYPWTSLLRYLFLFQLTET